MTCVTFSLMAVIYSDASRSSHAAHAGDAVHDKRDHLHARTADAVHAHVVELSYADDSEPNDADAVHTDVTHAVLVDVSVQHDAARLGSGWARSRLAQSDWRRRRGRCGRYGDHDVERRSDRQHPRAQLQPTAPAKNDRLMIIAGENKGQTGTLLGLDGTDGIVKMDSLDINIIEMSSLCRLP